MKEVILKISENKRIAEGIYRMRLFGDVSGITAPGQFVNIRLSGHFLRRPISVCEVASGALVLIYKILGQGTKEMTELTEGQELNVLTGLGNGFDLSACEGNAPLLIGGGVGIPPLYGLAKALIGEGKKPKAVLGFNGGRNAFYVDEFRELGLEVSVATADGSLGKKGVVTELLGGIDYSYFYSCGPEAMLKAVYKKTKTSGQLSFERRMGCGFGACMGCSCKTITGYKRICKEGPVLRKEEVLWED